MASDVLHFTKIISLFQLFGGCWMILIRWFVDLSVHPFELFVPLELKPYYEKQKYYYFDKSGSSKLYLKLASYITLAYFNSICKRFWRWMMMLVVDHKIFSYMLMMLMFYGQYKITKSSNWNSCRFDLYVAWAHEEFAANQVYKKN